ACWRGVTFGGKGGPLPPHRPHPRPLRQLDGDRHSPEAESLVELLAPAVAGRQVGRGAHAVPLGVQFGEAVPQQGGTDAAPLLERVDGDERQVSAPVWPWAVVAV